jgi:hypothetical protein
MRALKHANAIRRERIAVKAKMRAVGRDQARKIAAELIANPPSWAKRWAVGELLLAIPKVGRIKAARWIAMANDGGFGSITMLNRIGSLTDRQRRLLIDVIAPEYFREVE